jgi:hypothetical protein
VTASELAADRGIEEILHYTTEKGIYGAIVKQAVLSRRQLEGDPDLEFIFQAVWPVKAPAWADHISLSISRINLDLYDRSRRHYPDLWWGVLAFETTILDHDNVHFTTTNNIYPACERGQGEAGFEAIFADNVRGRYDFVHTRHGLQDEQPTDRAAEVLYPRQLQLEHLARIYVPGAEHRRIVHAWCDALGRDALPVEVRPDVFA